LFPGTNSTSALLQQQQRQQQQLLQHQDRQLGVMSDSVGNLRNVSSAIGRELDEQAVSWIVLLFFFKKIFFVGEPSFWLTVIARNACYIHTVYGTAV
jgi:hypothetical protein